MEERLSARRILDRIFRRHEASTKVIAVLHYLDGLTLEEVAEQVGLSVSGVRKRLDGLKSKSEAWAARSRRGESLLFRQGKGARLMRPILPSSRTSSWNGTCSGNCLPAAATRSGAAWKTTPPCAAAWKPCPPPTDAMRDSLPPLPRPRAARRPIAASRRPPGHALPAVGMAARPPVGCGAGIRLPGALRGDGGEGPAEPIPVGLRPG